MRGTVISISGALGLLIAVGGTVAAPVKSDILDVKSRFVGNYELIAFETLGPDGQLVRREMTGRIMYDAAGNMAAQLMPAKRQPAPEGADATARWMANRGYTAYFGTFDVNAAEESVTHHVQGSVNLEWVGADLVRYYEFSGDILKLSLKRDGRVTGTLTWRRLS